MTGSRIGADNPAAPGPPPPVPPHPAPRPLGGLRSHPGLVRILAAVFTFALPPLARSQPPACADYQAVQHRLAAGWNTWDVNSVTDHVLLPEGFALRIGLANNSALYADSFLPNVQLGLRGKGDPDVVPGPHTWNGSYTELRCHWHGHTVLLQSAHDGDDLVVLATPIGRPASLPPSLVIQAGVLWNREGSVFREGDHLAFSSPSRSVRVYWTGGETAESALPVSGPYFAAAFTRPIGLSTGRPRTAEQIGRVLERERPAVRSVAGAIETVMGWDTLYDPSKARVISPVSRLWSSGWGGYVLFDWDTFFAATLASVGDKDLAYADAVETLREATDDGFVPNYARPGGWKSFDRSEPPVGSLTVLNLFHTYHDSWLLRETFVPLLRWNRWWSANRDVDGYLVFGTDRNTRRKNPDDPSIGTLQGAKYESGLDNSPLYDDAPFDEKTGRMPVADVGLMGLYVADCNALADIAAAIGKAPEEAELRARSARYGAKLRSLWDPGTGIFLNRNLATGESSRRLAPTNFYPLLARVASPAEADRMVREHLLNPNEFWGQWVLPSIARNDPAFKDQEYWRGRIWGPMNYLVYLGLRNYGQTGARGLLAEKSLALFAREWGMKGHVHENYNAVTGEGDDVASSDRFYHWGALLGYMACAETGADTPLPPPQP